MDATVLQPDLAMPADHSSAGETDHLAGAVLRTLGRSHRNMYSLSPSQAFWMSIVSFGLWPLWRMGRQFRAYVVFERQQLWHLAEWLRLRRGGDDALALQGQLQPIQPNLAAKRFITLCILGVCAFIWLSLGDRISVSRIIDNTWALKKSHASHGDLNPLWLVWVVGLSAAYFAHWRTVRKHERAVDQFIGRLNRLLQREGVATVSPISSCVKTGEYTAGWWWSAGILAWFGGFWAIPMFIAGAAQRCYINTTSARVRAEMLERVQAILKQRRPAVAVPNYVLHTRRCGNDRCRASIRAGANFCSRCGTSAERMSEVA
jgi:hypothetical protein